MIQVFSITLVASGLVLLMLSARPAYLIWRDSDQPGWFWLLLLIASFIGAYGVFLVVLLNSQPSLVNLGLSGVLGAGGAFVIIVMRLSLRAIMTANVQTEREFYDARHDMLTGLPNRLCFMEKLDEVIEAAKKNSSSFAVLMLDLDHFKEINDTLGHAVGDKLLKQLGDRLRQLSQKDNVISRLGGDEFALLLPNISESQAIEETLNLFQAIDDQFMVEEHALMIDMSVGISLYPRDGIDQETLLKRADIAMYIAKKNKQKYRIYDESEDSLSVQRLGLLSRVKNALMSDEFELYYQPIFHTENHQLKGFEALIRWSQADGEQVSPQDFIPQIEQSRFISNVSRWVIRRALQQLQSWQNYPHPLTMSINLSAIDIQDRELTSYIRKLLKEFRIKPEQLCFEITENAILAEADRARVVIGDIIDLGAKIAMDDFGTGFSSLSLLRQCQFHIIKIDQSFVKEISGNAEDQLIVNSVVELTHSLGSKVVAEGVEDEHSAVTLEKLGCDYLQGYYLAKPMSYQHTTKWLDNYLASLPA